MLKKSWSDKEWEKYNDCKMLERALNSKRTSSLEWNTHVRTRNWVSLLLRVTNILSRYIRSHTHRHTVSYCFTRVWWQRMSSVEKENSLIDRTTWWYRCYSTARILTLVLSVCSEQVNVWKGAVFYVRMKWWNGTNYSTTKFQWHSTFAGLYSDL